MGKKQKLLKYRSTQSWNAEYLSRVHDKEVGFLPDEYTAITFKELAKMHRGHVSAKVVRSCMTQTIDILDAKYHLNATPVTEYFFNECKRRIPDDPLAQEACLPGRVTKATKEAGINVNAVGLLISKHPNELWKLWDFRQQRTAISKRLKRQSRNVKYMADNDYAEFIKHENALREYGHQAMQRWQGRLLGPEHKTKITTALTQQIEHKDFKLLEFNSPRRKNS